MAAYKFGTFVLDRDAERVTHESDNVQMTAKSFSVLALLVERAPAVVTRAEFEAAIWPEGFIEPANLTQTVYMVRKALAVHDAATVIETVNGRGYRIASSVSPEPPVAEQTAPARGKLFWRIASSLALAAGFAVAACLQPGTRLLRPITIVHAAPAAPATLGGAPGRRLGIRATSI